MSIPHFSRRNFLGAVTALPVAAGTTSAWAASTANQAISDVFSPGQTRPAASDAAVLGRRMRANVNQRLNKISLDDILLPFTKRPGAQDWAGEHVGKFLHAGVLALQRLHDPLLRKRLDHAARGLIRSQLKDGYLGTYTPDKYWTSWDVWSHKYNLIGLLAYHEFTRNSAALAACRKMGDLLCRTFGTGPGQLDIVAEKHSTHVGMAATSVLEPMVLLHRRTGNKRYLDFCHYILSAWEQPHGPKVLSSLATHGNVFKTANAKAYEMLSNVVGLAELYRTTGDAQCLKACENAWADIIAKRHYVIGSTSWAEHFEDDHVLSPGGAYREDTFISAGEGCVTVTWLQLNWQLLRLTGNIRYAETLERIAYNALLAAQHPGTGKICYFTPLVGRKRYGEVTHGILPDICCCASSQPRGIAMLANMMAGSLNNKAALIFYEPGTHELQVGAQTFKLLVEGAYPVEGDVKVVVQPAKPGRFPLVLRVPEWAAGFEARVGGETFKGTPGQWLEIDRNWAVGDVVDVNIPLVLRTSPAGKANPGKVYVERGPQVLAKDEAINKNQRLPQWNWRSTQLYTYSSGKDKQWLVPFADAGQIYADYTVPLEPPKG